jgi:hypothetical protein
MRLRLTITLRLSYIVILQGKPQRQATSERVRIWLRQLRRRQALGEAPNGRR